MTFRQLFFRKRLDADLAEEMREHLAERMEELIAAGVPADRAQQTAQKEFGNLTLLEERGRDVWRWQKLESVLHDARFGFRRLRQSPALTLVCIATLALGLGRTSLCQPGESRVVKPAAISRPFTARNVI